MQIRPKNILSIDTIFIPLESKNTITSEWLEILPYDFQMKVEPDQEYCLNIIKFYLQWFGSWNVFCSYAVFVLFFLSKK